MPHSGQSAATSHPAGGIIRPVLSPYDLSVVDEVTLKGWPEVERSLKQALEAFGKRPEWLAPERRARILTEVAGQLEAESETFAHLIAREGGKPVTDARIEVARAVYGLRYAAGHIGEALRGEVIPNAQHALSQARRMVTSRNPIGVVVAISAFNHPLNLIVHQVAPAIAVGAPVLVKPSLETPLSCLKLVAMLHAAGLPEAWCQTVLCENDVAEKLATDPRVAFVNFIGSAAVGWSLRGKIAPGTRCALEHGGNAPALVLPYANHDKAIPVLLKGGMTHAGQVCVSVQRVYVPWAEVGHFARKMGEAAEKLVVGNPISDETQVGPLITPAALQRVHSWVQEALTSGAKLMSGGQPLAETLYSPTVLLDPPADAHVTADEIFGPVICVYGYDDVDDAIRRANSSRYAFQAAVWGREYDVIQYAAERLDASTVMINDHTAFRADWMPFGGHKQSGLGVGGIPATMQDYTQARLVVG